LLAKQNISAQISASHPIAQANDRSLFFRRALPRRYIDGSAYSEISVKTPVLESTLPVFSQAAARGPGSLPCLYCASRFSPAAPIAGSRYRSNTASAILATWRCARRSDFSLAIAAHAPDRRDEELRQRARIGLPPTTSRMPARPPTNRAWRSTKQYLIKAMATKSRRPSPLSRPTTLTLARLSKPSRRLSMRLRQAPVSGAHRSDAGRSRGGLRSHRPRSDGDAPSGSAR
jgi:hypothetical protein